MAYFQHKNEQNDPVDYLPEDQDLQQDTWEEDEYPEDEQWEDDLEAEDREERRARRRDKMRGERFFWRDPGDGVHSGADCPAGEPAELAARGHRPKLCPVAK